MSMTATTEGDDGYRRRQSEIYRMQETLLDTTQTAETAGAAERVQEADPDGQGAGVDSGELLEVVERHYGARRCALGTIRYEAARAGRLTGGAGAALPFPYEVGQQTVPVPLLPRMGTAAINRLVTVELSAEDLESALATGENARVRNRELWGVDVYTCDSDPLLVLVHCGVLDAELSGQGAGSGPRRRTPANRANPDCVTRGVSAAPSVRRGAYHFDVRAQLLMLPPLQRYASAERFGLQSREWNTLHDGLSYGLYEVTILLRDPTLRDVGGADQITKVDW
ncbi:AER077Wp [Eremothecium gossypii ATCC 10895]|uniref:AER077Wp n=1 Tax=Eremothecium gossypii (strain ATCC 10895 / CBS 109.51 / FGSC 9923 / NRRL Y-1056) TaxID=284811 RepID=Q757D6_EREGS|nr:AER077Wp [Eremothecium gossypii ATCC 10895]AAS52761.1 AER077Wp [Eremothecium gossypii ATCC 10895]